MEQNRLRADEKAVILSTVSHATNHSSTRPATATLAGRHCGKTVLRVMAEHREAAWPVAEIGLEVKVAVGMVAWG